MSRKTYLTQIMLCSYGYEDRAVTFYHRRKPTNGKVLADYFEKRHAKPTLASQKRIDAVVTDWVNRNQAEIRLIDNTLFIEPTD